MLVRKSVSADLEAFGRQCPQLSMGKRGASEVRSNWNIESASDLPGLEDLGESQIVPIPVIPTRRYNSRSLHICGFAECWLRRAILTCSELITSSVFNATCELCQSVVTLVLWRHVPTNQAQSETHQEIERNRVCGIFERRLHKTTYHEDYIKQKKP